MNKTFHKISQEHPINHSKKKKKNKRAIVKNNTKERSFTTPLSIYSAYFNVNPMENNQIC